MNTNRKLSLNDRWVMYKMYNNNAVIPIKCTTVTHSNHVRPISGRMKYSPDLIDKSPIVYTMFATSTPKISLGVKSLTNKYKKTGIEIVLPYH